MTMSVQKALKQPEETYHSSDGVEDSSVLKLVADLVEMEKSSV